MFKTICLENVWYIPSCTKNLRSGSQVFSTGFGIHSSSSGPCITQGPDVIIATSYLKDGLFNLNFVSSSYLSSSISYLSSTKNTPSLSHDNIPFSTSNSTLLTLDNCSDPVLLFHNRFAHVSPRLVLRIRILDEMPANLKSKSLINLSKRYEVCISCKQVENINRRPCEKMDEPLKLVHSDTWGKYRVMGFEGISILSPLRMIFLGIAKFIQ